MSIHSTVAERSHFRAASFWVCETLSPEKRKRSRIPRRLTRGETDLPIGRCLLAEGGRIPGLGRFAPYRVQQERRKGPALRGNASGREGDLRRQGISAIFMEGSAQGRI